MPASRPEPTDRKRFLAAVCLASIYGIERFGFRSCVKAAWNVLHAMTVRQKNLDVALGEKRVSHCENCPIFWAPLRTCGSPLADDPKIGCWCQMDRKAPDPKMECWADTETDLNIGWKSAGL